LSVQHGVGFLVHGKSMHAPHKVVYFPPFFPYGPLEVDNLGFDFRRQSAGIGVSVMGIMGKVAVGYMVWNRELWSERDLDVFIGSSDVPAPLGLEATALASGIARPGQSHQ
jgi:hypothetical protein